MSATPLQHGTTLTKKVTPHFFNSGCRSFFFLGGAECSTVLKMKDHEHLVRSLLPFKNNVLQIRLRLHVFPCSQYAY